MFSLVCRPWYCDSPNDVWSRRHCFVTFSLFFRFPLMNIQIYVFVVVYTLSRVERSSCSVEQFQMVLINNDIQENKNKINACIMRWVRSGTRCYQRWYSDCIGAGSSISFYYAKIFVISLTNEKLSLGKIFSKMAPATYIDWINALDRFFLWILYEININYSIPWARYEGYGLFWPYLNSVESRNCGKRTIIGV